MPASSPPFPASAASSSAPASSPPPDAHHDALRGASRNARHDASAKPASASQTLLRGLAVIDAVAKGHATLPEIVRHTGLSSSTAHRLAAALADTRYLQHEPRRGYRLGSRLIELGFQAHRESDLVRQARPWLEQLAEQTQDTIHLAALVDDAVIYLDKLPGQRAVEIRSQIGGRNPVCTTGVGKALILDGREAQWRQRYARETRDLALQSAPQPAPHAKIPPEKAWIDTMRAYAARGSTLDLGEDEPSVRCVAAPVRDATGRIAAAISVSSAAQFMSLERMDQLADLVRRTASEISRQMGYQQR